MQAPLPSIAVAVFPERSDDHYASVKAQTNREVRVLGEGYAYEWDSDQDDCDIRLDGADVAVLPKDGRRKSLLICDMDSTLIGQECIDELADFAGVKDRVSAITERAMRGEIGFEGALRERVGLLESLPESVIEECYRERIRLNPGAEVLAKTMAASGAKTVIVSGGFTAFSAKVARAAGFRDHQANVLLAEDGRLTGKVAEPILGRDAKRDALLEHSGGKPETAIAIGDGANDLAMIQAAGMGVAYRAKPAVAAAAGYAIETTDLRTALFYQGYNESEFVEG